MAEVLPIRPRAAVRKGRTATPPTHLTRESRDIWRSITAEWVLGPDALPLLRAACEQWDIYQSARRTIQQDGAVVVNPDSGVVRQHPAHTVARDALREFRQLFRQLSLDPPEV